MTPTDAMTPMTAAVLAATIHGYAAEGRVTMQAIAARLGCSTETVLRHLRDLRDAGLVGWVDGKSGTLRPLVAPKKAP